MKGERRNRRREGEEERKKVSIRGYKVRISIKLRFGM